MKIAEVDELAAIALRELLRAYFFLARIPDRYCKYLTHYCSVQNLATHSARADTEHGHVERQQYESDHQSHEDKDRRFDERHRSCEGRLYVVFVEFGYRIQH